MRRIGTLAAALALAACASATSDASDEGPDAADAGLSADGQATEPDAGASQRRIVILMIGDGMGPGQIETASRFAHGAPGQLYMQSLPQRGHIRTASLSGITDSAAAATTMATGVPTMNAYIGVNRDGQPAETLIELAKRSGLGTGVVTTSSLPHATPASFTAHHPSRHDYIAIADQQALVAQPQVMLGGGAKFYRPAGDDSDRDDAGLIAPLQSAGYQVVTTKADLDVAVAAESNNQVVGLFADEHLDYVADRGAQTTQPTLTDMSMAAIELLDRNSEGFFLVIEGARIDMASHGNDLPRAIGETLAFDDAIRAVHQWAMSRDDVTLLVTADHECGGLKVAEPTPTAAGTLPPVTWRWGEHTNARVDIFGYGPGADRFAGAVGDFRWVHDTLAARIESRPHAELDPTLVPDGSFHDLRHTAATQQVATGFGDGFNQLDALHLDADASSLAIGIEGVFQWRNNAVVVLIDVDYGAGTGLAAPSAVSDADGRADTILGAMSVDAALPGFGADYALVVWGGSDPHLEDLIADAGLRGLPPAGQLDDLAWLGAAVNFGEGVRADASAMSPVSGEGLEVHVPWTSLYPDAAGQVPSFATVAVTAILVNDDGGYTSNQALPPFPVGTVNPGRDAVSLPGAVGFCVDDDGDGVGDGRGTPTLISP